MDKIRANLRVEESKLSGRYLAYDKIFWLMNKSFTNKQIQRQIDMKIESLKMRNESFYRNTIKHRIEKARCEGFIESYKEIKTNILIYDRKALEFEQILIYRDLREAEESLAEHDNKKLEEYKDEK